MRFFISIIIGLFIFANQSYSFELQPKSWSADQKGLKMLRDNQGYFLHDYSAVNNDEIRFLTHWIGPVVWKDRLTDSQTQRLKTLLTIFI